MIVEVYAIRDRAAGQFMFPMADVNDQTAKRNFYLSMSQRPDGVMAFSPDDFELYHIGQFDTEKAEFINEIPSFITNGADYDEVE